MTKQESDSYRIKNKLHLPAHLNLVDKIAKELFFFGTIVVLFSMPWAKSLSSVGIGIISGLGLVYFLLRRQTYTKNDYWLIAGFVLLYVMGFMSYFYSENSTEAVNKLFFKVPLLLAPFCIPLARQLSNKRMNLFIVLFQVMVFIVGLGSTIHYFSNYAEINASILHAKPVPVLGKITHIHYSILNALSIFCGVYLYSTCKKILLCKIGIILAAANFIMLHLLAARTGLVSFYLVAILAILIFTLKRKSWKGVALLGGLGLSILLAFVFSTSFKNRMIDTKKDLLTTINGTYPNHYSNTQRIIAFKTGCKIIEEQPFTGVGIGDVHDAMNVKYDELDSPLLPETRIKPHHQFAVTVLQSGIIAGLILLYILLILLVKNPHWLTCCFIGLYFTAMQFEATLERQAGFYVFILFYIFLASRNWNKTDEKLV